MLPWQPSRDAREMQARSRALWGAGIGYALMLLFLTFVFRSQKPLLSVKFRVGGPAAVVFHKGAKNADGKRGKRVSQQALYAAALLRKRAAMAQARKLRLLEQKKAAAERRALRKKKRDELVRKKAQAAQEKVARERGRRNELKRKKDAEKPPHEERKQMIPVEKPQEQPLAKKEPEPPVHKPEQESAQEKNEKKLPEPAVDPEQTIKSEEQAVSAEANDEELEEIVLGEETSEDDGETSRDVVALMAAISRVWRPPRGLSKVPQARLIVSVAGDGVVENVEIESKSGVIAYDMAARAALWRTVYPSVFWGKRIAVLFGQQ